MAIELIDDPEMGEEMQQEEAQHPADFLRSIMKLPNIVSKLDGEVVRKIGMEVSRGFDLDKGSRSEWEKQTKTAMDLAMQVVTEKSWPWPKAANIKYPMITTAAIQFSARAYPAIVSGQDVVKGEVLGPDPDGVKKERADRIGRHMSYQVLEEIEDWDEEEDKLLLQTSIVGCSFRKTYFDTMLGRPCSDLVGANYVVFDHATPWKKLRRITHCLNLFKNDVIERVRGGLFSDIELGMPEGADNDEDAHYEFLECHCWYDLDGDGYKEPYIVTVKKDTSEVVRIIARFDEDGIYLNDDGEIAKIIEVRYFTKFGFMPNPDGGSYDVGLGMLLNPINEAINTVFNQMLDAGTLANTGGGFLGSGLKMKGGVAKFVPGEFKPVDVSGGNIRDNVYHMQFPGPSNVLFQLLGMLIQAGKEMSSVQDIMTGEQQVNQTATTTMALIEQGQKVFSAIYKRIHRSLKQEFKKLYRLNKLYLLPQDYYRFQDRVETVYLDDYQGDDTDVTPASDPSLISDAQILARAEALLKFVGDPLFNQIELRKNYLKAMKIQNIEVLLVEEKPKLPPEVIQQIQQMQEQMQQIQQQAQKMQQEITKREQAVNSQEQQFALTEKDLQAAMAEIQAAKDDLVLREQLAIQKIEEATLRGEMDAQMREANINQLAAEKLENLANVEKDVMLRMMEKFNQQPDMQQGMMQE
ncbi:MAG: hypothetical protein WCD86_11090 [Ktedonobacteraceae bacterium]